MNGPTPETNYFEVQVVKRIRSPISGYRGPPSSTSCLMRTRRSYIRQTRSLRGYVSGLRRTSYDVNPATGLFEPEYVNVFGVPFTFLPHKGWENSLPSPAKPKTAIEPVMDRQERFEISWPNVVRINHAYRSIGTE